MHIKSIGIYVLAGAFALGLVFTTLEAKATDPEPFRREDVLEGRDFEYNDRSFLTRFTYRHSPSWDRLWEEADEQGFRITAGSTRSDELYVVNDLQKTLDFNDTFHGELRFRRSEDFDSRYDRLLVGVGAKLPAGFSFTALSDIVARKDDIDLHFESQWKGSHGFSLRAAFIAADYFFNDKNKKDARYSRHPYTYFLEAKLLTESSLFRTWINLTPETRLVFETEASAFRSRQAKTGMLGRTELSSLWSILGYVSYEEGIRVFEAELIENPDIRDLDRRAWEVNIEAHRRLLPELSTWFGIRYFYLEEEDAHPNDPLRDTALSHREPTAHTGIVWDISSEVSFSPGFYLAKVRHRDLFKQQDEDSSRVEHWIARMTFPLEYQFSETARATVNPTAKFPDSPFGGLNIQFQILF